MKMRKKEKRKRFHFDDPLGRPTLPAGSDHYFRTCFRPSASVPTFQNIAKQNKCRLKIMIAISGGTVGLAEWIIDDTYLISNLYRACKIDENLK